MTQHLKKIEKILLFLSLALFSFVFFKRLNGSPTMLSYNIVMVLFNLLVLNAVIFTTIRNIDWKRTLNIKQHLIFSSFLTSIFILFLGKFHNSINNFISSLLYFDSIKMIMDNGYITWGLLVITINLFISTVIDLKHNQHPYAKKMISKAVIIYGLLSISTWIFTHFIYVGSHIFYLSQEVKMIDSVIVEVVKNKKPLLPKQEDLFKRNVLVYDKTTLGNLERDLMEKFSKPEYGSAAIPSMTGLMKNLNLVNFYNNVETKYPIKNFWDMFSNSLNFPSMHAGKDVAFASEIIFANGDQQKTIPLQHGIIYAYKMGESMFVYTDVNKLFRENKENIIFNQMYISFHFLFWLAFLYLFSYHNKRVFNKTSKTT